MEISLMRRLAYLVLAALVLSGGVAATALNAPAGRAAQEHVQRPAGPQTPQDPFVTYLPAITRNFVTYLPAITRNYVAGYVVPFGIDMYLGNSDADGRAKMQAAGSGWMTVYFSWSGVEPNPPVKGVHTYDWSSFDTTVAQAQSAGMNVFALFSWNPAWAAALPGGPVTDTAQLVNIVTAMAERYDGDGDANNAPGSPVINYWSFYAEPDNGDPGRAMAGKGLWGNNPGGYAAMLTQIAPAIHAANPNAKVLIGGLAYDWFTTDPVNPGPFVRSFLTNTLSALNGYPGGVPRYLDAMAFHFYPISTWRWPTIREKALEIRGILDRNGAGSLPLIVPEMGYWSDPASGSSEAIQAQTLVQMYARGLSVGIQQMSWFAVFDAGSGSESHGLFRGNDLNSPKPAYTAYATLAAELYGANYFGALSGTNIEGYVFTMPGGSQKTVVWASGQPSAQVVFHSSCVRRVDYLGNVVTPIYDGNGTWDKDAVVGQITLQVAQDDPIYVSSC
jgi:hypothetical protein